MGRMSSVSGFTALLMALAGPVAAADLRDMKLLQDGADTRAVLELGDPGAYKLFALENPQRLVLDLSEARLSPGFRLPPPNGAITGVRTGRPVPGTLRIVFEMSSAVTTRSRMERDGATPRLVIEMAARSAGSVATSRNFVPPQAALITSPPLPRVEPRIAPVELPSESAPAIVSAMSLAVPAPELKPREFAAIPPPLARNPVKTLRDVVGNGQRKLVVAIDAGHGGKDPGAHGPSGVREKNITLAVARELARQVNADPGMHAVLIRDGDSFVPLKTRYMKARSAQADLFISIHADASPNNTANGASVFVLSTRGASSQAARWLADKENAADLVGGVSLDQKDHNLAAVLLDLSQSATMRASDDIANQVLGSLKNVGKAHKPSIERANFVVLRSPDVPSMLVETGFITNPDEEQRLNDAGYRSRLAAAITEGVRRYFTDQPPAGSWYARRDEQSSASRMPLVMASTPE